MNKSELSTFTEENNYQVDERRFMGDLDITNSPVMKTYQKLIQQSKYTEARDLLNQSNVFSYSAWFFNMINNRLHAIDDHMTKTFGPRPEYTKYQDPEPTRVPLYTSWVSGLDMFATLRTITIRDALNGRARSNPVQGIDGDFVQLYIDGEFGYSLDHWNVIRGGIEIDENQTFILEDADVVLQPIFKLTSLTEFPIHITTTPPTGFVKNGVVMIDIDLDAESEHAIYDNTEPTGVPIGSCWIGVN